MRDKNIGRWTAGLLFASAALAADLPDGVHPTIATDLYQEWVETDNATYAGMIIGFALLAIFWFYTLGSLINDEIKRHKKYDKEIEDKIAMMPDLGLDKQELDEKFIALKNKKKGDDDLD